MQSVELRSIEAYIVQVYGAARNLTRSELSVLRDHVEAIVTTIEEAWPVDTSTSRDGWYYTLDTAAGVVGFTISNDVEYVDWVHYSGDPTVLIDTVVPDAIDGEIPGLLADLRAEIDATQAAVTVNVSGQRGLIDIFQRARVRNPHHAAAVTGTGP